MLEAIYMVNDRIGGMTVDEMMERMTCDELDHRLAYMKKHDDPKGLRI